MDGFNLYYGALKNTQYKWLDILVLCQRLLNRNNQIEGIHYFTALVNGSPDDPSKGRRQQLYLKALSLHIPFFDVEWGQFTRHLVQVPLAPSDLSKLPEGTKIPVGQRQSVFNTQWVPRDRYFGVKVDIVKTEEKGSDVNLALKLLQHAWEDRLTVQ